MYTQKQVDDMLSQVEQEFEKTLGSIAKSEEVIDEVETEEVELSKNETEEEIEEEAYQTIDELYESMDKSEKEAHYASVKKAMFGETEEESFQKSEETEEEEEIETSMVKSEREAYEGKIEGLEKNLDTVNELLSKLFAKKAPTGKAITATNFIAKSEETEVEKEDFSKLSKGEITSRLQKVDYATLNKSERESINDYYLENGSVDKIKHLITE